MSSGGNVCSLPKMRRTLHLFLKPIICSGAPASSWGTMLLPSCTRIGASRYMTPSNIILSRTNIRDTIREFAAAPSRVSTVWVRGYPEQAVNRCKEALALANQEQHPLTVAIAYYYLSQLYTLRREADQGQRWAEKTIEISEKYVLPLFLAQGRFHLGWALAEQGHLVQGIELIRNGITGTRATGALMGFPFFLSVLAGAYLDSGELRQAAATLDEALSVATEARALYFFPEVLGIKGKLLLLQDPDHPEAAQACFQQAVTAAREQGAKSLELRGATSLARLWRGQGKHTEARELLAPVYGWFTEGFDTRDLKEAKALLAELVAG